LYIAAAIAGNLDLSGAMIRRRPGEEPTSPASDFWRIASAGRLSA